MHQLQLFEDGRTIVRCFTQLSECALFASVFLDSLMSCVHSASLFLWHSTYCLLLTFHVRAQVRIAHLGGYFSLPPGLHCCCSMSKPLLLFGTLTAWLRSVAPILFQGGWAVFCKLRVRAAFFFSLSSSHPWLMFTCVMLRSCLLVLCQIGPMGLQGNISDASAVIQYMCNQADVQMVSIRM